jgi:dihydroorotate dehydrogenase (fumarate)
MDLTTRYLGLTLPHPFMPGASPLTEDLDTVCRLEDAGAAAIVMHSLFEEDIHDGAAESDAYLEQVLRIRRRVRVPVIASLNGANAEGWLQYARLLARAGADAVELNFYYIPTDALEDGRIVEARLLDIVAVLKESVPIPIAVKLSPFYSALPNLAWQLDRLGADGLILFSRFHQPDIDPGSLDGGLRIDLSDSSDLLLPLRWTAILANRLDASLALSGGVHEPLDAVKAVLAGADAVQIVSALLRRGPAALSAIREGFERWAGANGYGGIDQMRGRMSLEGDGAHPTERTLYKRTLKSWHASRASVAGH